MTYYDMTGDGEATREEKRKKRKQKNPDDEMSVLTDHHPDGGGEQEKKDEHNNESSAVVVAVGGVAGSINGEPQALVVAGKKKKANRSEKSDSKFGGFISSSSDEESVVVQVVEKGDSDDEDYGPYQSPPGLPEGWIEVIDPEVPDHLDPGTRVLVSFGTLSIPYTILLLPPLHNTNLSLNTSNPFQYHYYPLSNPLLPLLTSPHLLPLVDGSDKRYGNIIEAVLGESLYKVMLDWGKDDEAKEQDKMRVKKMKRKIIRRAARAAGT